MLLWLFLPLCVTILTFLFMSCFVACWYFGCAPIFLELPYTQVVLPHMAPHLCNPFFCSRMLLWLFMLPLFFKMLSFLCISCFVAFWYCGCAPCFLNYLMHKLCSQRWPPHRQTSRPTDRRRQTHMQTSRSGHTSRQTKTARHTDMQYVCMQVCMYACMCACMCVCMHVRLYVWGVHWEGKA